MPEWCSAVAHWGIDRVASHGAKPGAAVLGVRSDVVTAKREKIQMVHHVQHFEILEKLF